VRDLAEWYKVDQATIRDVLQPHVRLVKDGERERERKRGSAG
jgi:hypothetical protein